MPFTNGWIYHLDFGWVLCSMQMIFKWTLVMDGNEGWIWTGENIWPYLWTNKSGNWLYFGELNG